MMDEEVWVSPKFVLKLLKPEVHAISWEKQLVTPSTNTETFPACDTCMLLDKKHAQSLPDSASL